MALYVEDPETDRLAHALAQRRGETVEAVLRAALEEQWRREQGPVPRPRDWMERLQAITHRCAALPDLDLRSADEILGYDENGLPS